jgi:hypothetical protein
MSHSLRSRRSALGVRIAGQTPDAPGRHDAAEHRLGTTAVPYRAGEGRGPAKRLE